MKTPMPKPPTFKTAPASKGAAPGKVKPAIKIRHIKLGAKSAFPAQPAAFGPADPGAGASAFPAGPDMGPGAGDAGS